MKLNITYEVVRRDKSGKVLEIQKTPGHSFVVAFLEILGAHMTGATVAGVTDISDNDQSIPGQDIDNLASSAPSGTNKGVVVGTGSTAVAITDNKLVTLIADGSASGQLQHGTSQIIVAPTVTGATAQFGINRTFLNSSGGTIVVAEVGLHGTASLSTLFFLFAREVLGATISVLDTETISVTATIQISA